MVVDGPFELDVLPVDGAGVCRGEGRGAEVQQRDEREEGVQQGAGRFAHGGSRLEMRTDVITL